jgi:hypothetical protein
MPSRYDTPESPIDMTRVVGTGYERMVEATAQASDAQLSQKDATRVVRATSPTPKPRVVTQPTITRSDITWTYFRKEVLEGKSDEDLRAKYILDGLPDDFINAVRALEHASDSPQWQEYESQIYSEWMA